MSYSPTFETRNGIVADVSGNSCLTIADAARRLCISRSTLARAIKRGKVHVVTRGNGIRAIKVAELRHAYRNGTRTPATAMLSLSAEAEGSRLAQMEADLQLSRSRVNMLETQLGTSKEKAAEQRQKIDRLHVENAPDLPGVDAGLRETHHVKYTSRKRRSKVKKMLRRLRTLLGVATLIMVTTGSVIGIVYAIGQWDQHSAWTQSSTY